MASSDGSQQSDSRTAYEVLDGFMVAKRKEDKLALVVEKKQSQTQAASGFVYAGPDAADGNSGMAMRINERSSGECRGGLAAPARCRRELVQRLLERIGVTDFNHDDGAF